MEQLERTRRYLDRMRRLYRGVPAEWDRRREFEDDVYSFFVHCYHVRDWFFQMNKINLTEKELEEFVGKHHALRICADLCNGTKHCRLTKKLRTKDQPHLIGRKSVGHSEGTAPEQESILSSQFTILSEGVQYDALELAEACMFAWDDLVNWLKANTPPEKLKEL
jgi:hypothetical protein